jgi:ankyrin repeat protein
MMRFLFVVAAFILISSPSFHAKEEEVDKDFFFACSGGKADQVWKYLQEHPDWNNAHTPEGETCLHLAAIPGSESVTKLLLESGADPNVRTTFEGGLRMHPLSWNIYGGHYENVKLLLEHGAHVNADVDDGKGNAITVLDANAKFLGGEPGPYTEQAEKIQKLLLEYGAKAYVELQEYL